MINLKHQDSTTRFIIKKKTSIITKSCNQLKVKILDHIILDLSLFGKKNTSHKVTTSMQRIVLVNLDSAQPFNLSQKFQIGM